MAKKDQRTEQGRKAPVFARTTTGAGQVRVQDGPTKDTGTGFHVDGRELGHDQPELDLVAVKDAGNAPMLLTRAELALCDGDRTLLAANAAAIRRALESLGRLRAKRLDALTRPRAIVDLDALREFIAGELDHELETGDREAGDRLLALTNTYLAIRAAMPPAAEAPPAMVPATPGPVVDELIQSAARFVAALPGLEEATVCATELADHLRDEARR